MTNHHDRNSGAVLSDRLVRIGVPFLETTIDGQLCEVTSSSPVLGVMLEDSSPLQRELCSIASAWALQASPPAHPAGHGVWFVPLPLTARRQRVGYGIGLLFTEHVLEEGALASIVGRGADLEALATIVGELPPVPETEVPRYAALIRDAHADLAACWHQEAAISSLTGQLSETSDEINHIYTILRTMRTVDRPELFVRIACLELLDTLPYDWVAISVSDEIRELLALREPLISAGTLPVSTTRLAAHARRLAAELSGPIVLEPSRGTDGSPYAELGRPTVAHPIRGDDDVLGLLLVGGAADSGRAPSSSDIQLLGATANHLAIFLENSALYEDLNSMFLGTLEALTSSIDAKDRYTCGHSRRVAHLAQSLARAIGLDEAFVARTRIAGLVHDVGKIGVPEQVLLKPGALSDLEFESIRRHPGMGHQILKDIPQFRDILPGVLHHHERWDGGGYPAGLSGDDIPEMGRLIALADAFDAMSSDRTYRARRHRDEVLEEILACAGSQFDPTMAEAFVELNFRTYDRMVAEHHQAELAQGSEQRAAA